MTRTDHPNNMKQGGICIFCNGTLGIWINKLLCFCECSIFEFCMNYSIGYKSPSQDNTEFENFLSKFDKMLSSSTSCNSSFSTMLDDFNARSSYWWDKDKTAIESILI